MVSSDLKRKSECDKNCVSTLRLPRSLSYNKHTHQLTESWLLLQLTLNLSGHCVSPTIKLDPSGQLDMGDCLTGDTVTRTLTVSHRDLDCLKFQLCVPCVLLLLSGQVTNTSQWPFSYSISR